MQIFKILGKAALSLNVEFRRVVYDLYSPTSVINVHLDRETRVVLRCSGNIPKILFAEQRLVRYGRSFESLTLKLFKKLLRPGSIIIDVGANVGMYSIFFTRVAERCKIYAFEPNEETRNILKDNITLNGTGDRVVVFPFALSDSDSDAYLVCPEGKDAFAFLSNSEGKDSVAVKQRKLDTFISEQDIKQVNLLKVDIEGAELLFLKGAERTLREHRPLIVFELANQWTSRFDYIPSDVVRWLGDRNFVCLEYEHEQWIAIPSEHLEAREEVKAILSM